MARTTLSRDQRNSIKERIMGTILQKFDDYIEEVDLDWMLDKMNLEDKFDEIIEDEIEEIVDEVINEM